MDVALELLDPLVLDQAYAYFAPAAGTPGSPNDTTQPTLGSTAAPSLSSPCYGSWLQRDDILRQCISILIITQIGVLSLYWTFSAMSYFLVFDRRLEHHPRFLKNQIRQEMWSSMNAVPWINIMTLPLFLGEVRGKSLLYSAIEDYGWAWLAFSAMLFIMWNDFFIYWIHRLEHHSSIYKYIHKSHHKWIGVLPSSKSREKDEKTIWLTHPVPTPWAALAFHPLDGYLQSLPYHVFVYVFPMHKYLYMAMFILVQVWTIFIHDGDMISDHWLKDHINSPAHHTLHHLYFTVNYGQYFTWADRCFNSHRAPKPDLDPLHDALKVMRTKGLGGENSNPILQKPKTE